MKADRVQDQFSSPQTILIEKKNVKSYLLTLSTRTVSTDSDTCYSFSDSLIEYPMDIIHVAYVDTNFINLF